MTSVTMDSVKDIWSLALSRWQDTIWTNEDPVHWRTFTLPGTLCWIGQPSETHNKPKYRAKSFAHNMILSYSIALKFCTKHRNDNAQNFRAIGQSKRVFWTEEIVRDSSFRCVGILLLLHVGNWNGHVGNFSAEYEWVHGGQNCITWHAKGEIVGICHVLRPSNREHSFQKAAKSHGHLSFGSSNYSDRLYALTKKPPSTMWLMSMLYPVWQLPCNTNC